MHDQDKLLERYLKALESGTSLETIVNNLPADQRDLEPLLRLAASVRTIPHPTPLLQTAQARRQMIMRAARANNGSVQKQSDGLHRLLERGNLRWALVPAFGGVVGLFAVLVIAMIGLGIWFRGPQGAQAATLMDITGQVEVSSAQAGEGWQNVTNGDQVKAGQNVRTLSASSATLVFYDGTRTSLGPNSNLTLTRVDGEWGKVIRVVLAQNAGKTNNSVVPFKGKNSSFMVFTPSGAASVHGTNFSVLVDTKGESRFAVNAGKVLVSNDTSQLFLTAGQAAEVQSNQVLETPAYQFSLKGVLNSDQGSTWIVSGVPFTVTAQTLVDGNPQVGDTIHVEGRILENGGWVADSIEPALQDPQSTTFTGELQSMEGDTWKIGNAIVVVDQNTDLGEGLTSGTIVRVTFTTMTDGRWLATKIEALGNENTEPTPTPSATPGLETPPSLVFQPGELNTQVACGASAPVDFTMPASLMNASTTATNEAKNIQLGYQVIHGAEFVDGVDFNPTTFTSIPAGVKEAFNIHVVLNPSHWHAVSEDTEVKLRVFVVNEANLALEHPAILTVTIEANCEATQGPTNTADVTATATITAATTLTATATSVPTEVVTLPAPTAVSPSATPVATDSSVAPNAPAATTCTGANPQPTGLTLAQRYGVQYEEIMGWFCQGYGFGEIDMAYSLSLQSGKSVPEIFALRQSGLGWGEIKKQLGSQPSNGNPPPKKDNPHKK